MSRWKTLKSETLLKSGLLRIRCDECELPDGRIMPRYYVLEFPDWVNVVPITSEGKVILVKQHRHGVERDFLEIPGGSTDFHSHEEPRMAAERELLEETGYSAKEWIYCGFHYPNPALQNNRMHTFVALGCERTAEPQLDPYEDLETALMSWDETIQRYLNGEFSHSLIYASLGISFKTLKQRGYKISL